MARTGWPANKVLMKDVIPATVWPHNGRRVASDVTCASAILQGAGGTSADETEAP